MGRPFSHSRVISLLAPYARGEFPKKCLLCFTIYDKGQWEALKLDGQTLMPASPEFRDARTGMVEPADRAHILEFRMCPCKGSMCVRRELIEERTNAE